MITNCEESKKKACRFVQVFLCEQQIRFADAYRKAGIKYDLAHKSVHNLRRNLNLEVLNKILMQNGSPACFRTENEKLIIEVRDYEDNRRNA